MHFKKITCLAMLVTAVVVSGFSGCGGGPDVKQFYDSNMKKLLLCYNIYLQEHQFKGPANEEEFKDYLKNDPTAVFLMKRIDLEPGDIDDLFINERDGEPFVIRYGLKGENDYAIVFEKTGVDGKRYVALSEPIEVDAELYEKYLAGEIKAEGPSGSYEE